MISKHCYIAIFQSDRNQQKESNIKQIETQTNPNIIIKPERTCDNNTIIIIHTI